MAIHSINMDFAIVDLQGFKNKNNDFIVKEICVYMNKSFFHESVKSPQSFHSLDHETRIQARWLFRNFHGLLWDEGNIALRDVINLIGPYLSNKTILVKGEEKIKWIKYLLKNDDLIVLNAEDYGFSNTDKSNDDFPCNFHKQKRNVMTLFHCALKNVTNINRWLSSLEETEISSLFSNITIS